MEVDTPLSDEPPDEAFAGTKLFGSLPDGKGTIGHGYSSRSSVARENVKQ
jgi:hypothetical protein